MPGAITETSTSNAVNIRSSCQVSKAGQAIAKLRKNANKEIAKLASDIVAKWKQSVDANKKKRKLEDGGDKEGNGAGDAKKTKLEDGKAGEWLRHIFCLQ